MYCTNSIHTAINQRPTTPSEVWFVKHGIMIILLYGGFSLSRHWHSVGTSTLFHLHRPCYHRHYRLALGLAGANTHPNSVALPCCVLSSISSSANASNQRSAAMLRCLSLTAPACVSRGPAPSASTCSMDCDSVNRTVDPVLSQSHSSYL